MLGQKCLLPMDACTGCCLFDASDWRGGNTATHHRPSGNSMMHWQAQEIYH